MSGVDDITPVMKLLKVCDKDLYFLHEDEDGTQYLIGERLVYSEQGYWEYKH